MDDGLNYHVLLSVVGTDSKHCSHQTAGNANVANVFPSLMIGIPTRHDMQLHYLTLNSIIVLLRQRVVSCFQTFAIALKSAASPPLFESVSRKYRHRCVAWRHSVTNVRAALKCRCLLRSFFLYICSFMLFAVFAYLYSFLGTCRSAVG